MSKLSDTIGRNRRELAELEEQATLRMLNTWNASRAALRFQLEELVRLLDALIERGESPSLGLLERKANLTLLLNQLDGEIDRLSNVVSLELPVAQITTARTTAQTSLETIWVAMGPGPLPESARPSVLRFNPATVESLVGSIQHGSPLRRLLDDLKEDGHSYFLRTMSIGLERGLSPRELGSELADSLNLPIQRATTITRTELNRTYRETNLEAYNQNSDVVEGWVWTCARNTRTCAMCIAMDGKFFPSDVSFGSHPNCRCVPRPQTKSWAELGYDAPDRRPSIRPASEWFSALKEKDQLKILGPRKFALYKAGSLSLDDLVGYRETEDWGPTRWERSLKQIENKAFSPPREGMGRKISV